MITVVEVEPNANGPWDPATEVKIGDFATMDEALAFVRQSMLEEGWDQEELDAMPPLGVTGCRFQVLTS